MIVKESQQVLGSGGQDLGLSTIGINTNLVPDLLNKSEED